MELFTKYIKYNDYGKSNFVIVHMFLCFIVRIYMGYAKKKKDIEF